MPRLRRSQVNGPGIHRVKATLPGYRDLNLQIIVTPSADKDEEGANDEMKRLTRENIPKLAKLAYETEGDIFFDASLASVRVLLDGHETGVGFQFTAAQPLRLRSPACLGSILLVFWYSSMAIQSRMKRFI